MRSLIGILLVLATGFAGASPEPRKVPWPPAATCAACIRIQFDHIELKLPPALTARIVVPDIGVPALALLSDPESADTGIYLLHENPSPILDLLKRDGLDQAFGIRALPDLLRLTGKARRDTRLKPLFEALGFDEKATVTRAQRGPITVWRIRHPNPIDNHLYIAIDGHAKLYKISGAVTDATWRALLAHMAFRPPP